MIVLYHKSENLSTHILFGKKIAHKLLIQMFVSFCLAVTAHDFIHIQLVLVAIGTKQNFVIIKYRFFAINFVLANGANIPILANVI